MQHIEGIKQRTPGLLFLALLLFASLTAPPVSAITGEPALLAADGETPDIAGPAETDSGQDDTAKLPATVATGANLPYVTRVALIYRHGTVPGQLISAQQARAPPLKPA